MAEENTTAVVKLAVNQDKPQIHYSPHQIAQSSSVMWIIFSL